MILPDAENPLVSVILPVYNGAKTLQQAVESVLLQTYPRWELLIVNDGSTDETASVIRSFRDPRVRALHLGRNVGRSRARNFGAEKAAGTLLAMIDADDLWYPERLTAQARYLKDHPEIALCGSWAHLRTSEGDLLDWEQPMDPRSVRGSLLWFNPFIHCTILVRKTVFEEAGGYDSSLDFAEDYDLYFRIARKHPMANIPIFLAEYRYHTSLGYKRRDLWGKLRVRSRALLRYGYPKIYSPCLLLPFLTAWIPIGLGVWLKSRVKARRCGSDT